MKRTLFFRGAIWAGGLFAVSCAVSATFAGPVRELKAAPPGTLTTEQLAALRAKADPFIASSDDVALRHASPDVFRLVDALVAAGQYDEAEPYLARVLKACPGDFAHQLTYAEILARKGQPELLKKRATQALEHAEDDATLRRACEHTGKKNPPAPGPLDFAAAPRAVPELVLLKLGDVSDFWLADLRDALAKKLGLPVRVASLPVDVGTADRTALGQFAAHLRAKLLQIMETDPQLRDFLAIRQINRNVLENSDDVVIRAVRFIETQRGGAAAAAQFDARIGELRTSGPQWSAPRLLAAVEQSLPARPTAGRWFLAVTDRDIYGEGSNFLFGLAGSGRPAGLISAARFTATLNDEMPMRSRLVARLEKQALSSLGFMLGVPRCSEPMCARAYPHSLAEHDAKPDRLCSECRAAFEKALGTMLPNDP